MLVTHERVENGSILRLTGQDLACHRGGRLIFEGLGFQVRGGELMAVTGANGAGKSTLLRLIAGLLRASAGSVTYEGPDGGSELARALHYFGHQDAVKSGFSVRQDLAFWTRYWGGRGDPVEALETVGLGGLAEVPAGALSAGQRRRLALARLVTVRRPVWLLDEPTSALDKASEAMLGGLIAAHLERGGIAIAATHQTLPRDPDLTLAMGEPVAEAPA